MTYHMPGGTLNPSLTHSFVQLLVCGAPYWYNKPASFLDTVSWRRLNLHDLDLFCCVCLGVLSCTHFCYFSPVIFVFLSDLVSKPSLKWPTLYSALLTHYLLALLLTFYCVFTGICCIAYVMLVKPGKI